MIEVHPYPPFVPIKTKYLIIGSFPGKSEPGNDWYYGSSRNQFWKIIEKAFDTNLTDIKSKKKLLKSLKFAITDIIYSCERMRESNLDNNLINITFNIQGINIILKQNNIEKIFFTSRFVENTFRRLFKTLNNDYPNIKLITLPSPSPRYTRMTLDEKLKSYKKLLPKSP